MAIKRTSIETLKNRVSLVDVAGRYTQLKKRGNTYVGLSPFTKEKTPSFTIDPGKNLYYCFSSNQGGDLISFVQAMEKLDFGEAIETLAERYNIPLEYEEGSKSAPRIDRSLKKELQEIHLYAAEFYQKALRAQHPEAEAVRKYWVEERKFSLEVAQEFGIGYAPADPYKLGELLEKKSFSAEAMRQCGLYFGPGRPRFRGRLMIPLKDTQGNVIAFSGRKLPQTPADDPAYEAKYVNSPETPIFKKGAMLFNFDRARSQVQAQGYFLMVEGQLDAIRVASSGYPAVIAPQGTAITPEQLSMIQRYEPRLKVFLDGDRAGQAAALRMLPMALAAQLDVSFLKLPAGIDPDLYFRQNTSLEGLESLSPIQFAAQALWPAEVTAQNRTLALEKIFELISAAPSAITREAFLEELIRTRHLEPRVIRPEFEKFTQAPKSRPPSLPSGYDEEPKSQQSFNKNLTTAEFELLWLLVHHPELGGKIAPLLDHNLLEENDLHSQTLNLVLAEASEGNWDPPAAIERLSGTHPAVRALLFGLLARPLPTSYDPIAIANSALRAIHSKYVKTQLDNLREALSKATDPAEQAELLKKQQNLLNSQKKVSFLHHA